jgi:hypothetical protein
MLQLPASANIQDKSQPNISTDGKERTELSATHFLRSLNEEKFV